MKTKGAKLGAVSVNNCFFYFLNSTLHIYNIMSREEKCSSMHTVRYITVRGGMAE